PPAILIHAVMSEVDARQHDLMVSVVYKAADFVEDVLRGSAGKLRTHVRNNAEAATQHAAILHFDERPLPAGESGNADRQVGHAPAGQHVGQLAFVGHNFDDAG